jgi:aerobic-type carbon monoxide dehydrogenase small subunit (CoxS/CutS family)
MSTAKNQRRLGRPASRQPLTVEVDGEPVPAFAGESVATVLLALGRRTFRHNEHGAPRGLYCGMGVCFDCLVTVDGVENVRACMTPVVEGMVIATTGGPDNEGGAQTGDAAHE